MSARPREYVCEHCGQRFMRRPSYAGRRERFCSLSCSGASRRIVATCQVCGVQFRPTTGTRSTAKYCSQRCNGAAKSRSPEMRAHMRRISAVSAAQRSAEAAARPKPHGLSMYIRGDCKCEVCSEAGRAARARSRRGRPRSERERERQEKWLREKYEQSLAAARRLGYAWTGPELELLERPDLTTRQLAAMLGRTTYAVTFQRAKLRRGEPRSVNLAGVR